MNVRELPWKLIGIAGVIILLSAAISGVLAYRSGKNSGVMETKKLMAQQSSSMIKTSPLFQGQIATILGKITAIKDGIATVQALNGDFDEFAILPHPIQSKQVASGIGQFTPVEGDVIMDSFANINLEVKNGAYVITTIIYLPDSVNNFAPKPSSNTSTSSASPQKQPTLTPVPTTKP
jgi:hypothetical protein